MKKLTALLLFIAASQARADLVIVNSMEVKGSSAQPFITKVKGDRFRTDTGSQTSMITNTATGQVLMLLHPQKNFMKMPLAPSVAVDPGATPVLPPVITDTGRQEKVGEYNAEIYTTEGGGMKFTYWISREVPYLDALREYLKKAFLMRLKMVKQGPESVPDITALNGVPVKVVVITTTGETITTTLISVKEQRVDDSEFLLPEGYLEVPSPDVFGKRTKATPTSADTVPTATP